MFSYEIILGYIYAWCHAKFSPWNGASYLSAEGIGAGTLAVSLLMVTVNDEKLLCWILRGNVQN